VLEIAMTVESQIPTAPDRRMRASPGTEIIPSKTPAATFSSPASASSPRNRGPLVAQYSRYGGDGYTAEKTGKPENRRISKTAQDAR